MTESRFRPPWRLLATACLCVAVLFGVVTPAPAGVLLPGTSIANDGLAATAAAGELLEDTGYVAFTQKNASGVTKATGFVRQIVIRGDTSNVLRADGLDLTFLYHAVLTSGNISQITVSVFGGFLVDASAVTTAVQNPVNPAGTPIFTPSTTADGVLSGALPISRSAGPGNNVSFDFATIPPDASTVVMIVRTDATSYSKTGTLATINGGVSANLVFEPAVAGVPEPGTMTLLGIGLAGMGGYGWRRRRQGTAKELTPVVS